MIVFFTGKASSVMRALIIVFAGLCVAVPAHAKDRANFIHGQYATKNDCEKLRKIEAGGPRNIESVPELLDATGIHGFEGDCEFTKVFDHEIGKSWVAIMVCSEAAQMTAQNYLFLKNETEDSFDVASPDAEMPDIYARCDAKKGR